MDGDATCRYQTASDVYRVTSSQNDLRFMGNLRVSSQFREFCFRVKNGTRDRWMDKRNKAIHAGTAA